MIRAPGSSARPDQPLAVIIGGGGMGAGIARRLGDDHRLLIVDRDKDRLDALAGTLEAGGHDVSTATCDITDAGEVQGLAQRVGPWRALAHVAALSPSMADFRTIMAVNLCGARHVEQAFGATAGMGSAGIFISSLAAHAPAPDEALQRVLDTCRTEELIEKIEALLPNPQPQDAYRISKFAMNRMCRSRAAAWGKRGARIVSLSPGLIATPMGALEFKGSPEKMALYEKSPLQREGTTLEIAATVGFLASPQASFISGTDILVDGGIAAALAFPDEG